jgi:cyclophilin family peptidyl-prolyl cis-trans isomerase
MMSWLCLALFSLFVVSNAQIENPIERFSNERVVFQTKYGDFEFAFMPDVAPKTVKHIFELVQLGLYQSNHIFRVDRGFVAQTADVASGRSEPMNDAQKAIASRNVPLEVVKGVKHTEGALSIGRYDDPNSGGSSFSVLLGTAGHLDMVYTIFARVTKGMEVVHSLENLKTRREGIFVMPLERITITGTYWYNTLQPFFSVSTGSVVESADCESKLDVVTSENKDWSVRFESMSYELQRVRKKCLPA